MAKMIVIVAFVVANLFVFSTGNTAWMIVVGIVDAVVICAAFPKAFYLILGIAIFLLVSHVGNIIQLAIFK